MSRIGKLPIAVPDGVSVAIQPGTVSVSGPKGRLSVPVPDGIAARLDGGSLRISCEDPARTAMQGLTRSLANNCVTGVTKGFSKRLEIVGVGYRVNQSGRVLTFQLGYSHPIEVLLPDGIDAKVQGNNKIEISGIDKQAVGQVAANIRGLRKPDPYKQKGVRYEGEKLRSKEGKSGSAA